MTTQPCKHGGDECVISVWIDKNQNELLNWLHFLTCKKNSQQGKILPVLRTALKGCQDSAAINMSVCGDPSEKK